MTKKIGRALDKKCPECLKYYLRIITYTTDKDGKIFQTSEIECSKCGYSEPYHLSQKHFKIDRDSKNSLEYG